MKAPPLRRRYLRFLGPDVRADVDDELRHHLEMRARELIEGGMLPEDARAEALRQFGDVDGIERDLVALGERRVRKARWHDRLGGSWLDLKLGFRMLLKHPGLTVVSVLAMATAVGVAALLFAVLHNIESPTVPLDEGDRLVNLQRWSPVRNMASSAYLHDFAHWRGRLRSVETLGAYRVVQRNLITDDGRSEPVQGAEMSASGFPAARVAPLLGRPLLAADEQPGAPDVVVIGYGLWQDLFGGDADAVGRTIRIDGTPHTVVGVVPDLGMNLARPTDPSGLYLPLTPATYPVMLVVRSSGDASAFPPRLRAIAAEVDPTLRLMEVGTLAAAMDEARARGRALELAIAVATLVGLVLSLTTVCAVMSLLVSQRTREIGIRIALGARPARVVLHVVARAFLQLGAGAVVGTVLIVVLPVALGAGSVGVAAQVAAFLVGAGLLACAAPAHRALRIPPTEAMRIDA